MAKISYRKNDDWGSVFFEGIDPEDLEEELEQHFRDSSFDVEVIDVTMTSFEDDHNILVMFRKIRKVENEASVK